MARAADAYNPEDQTVRNVKDAILLSIVGRREGALIEETLWPAIESCGVDRTLFNRAIATMKRAQQVIQSYDRLYHDIGQDKP